MKPPTKQSNEPTEHKKQENVQKNPPKRVLSELDKLQLAALLADDEDTNN